LTQNNY